MAIAARALERAEKSAERTAGRSASRDRAERPPLARRGMLAGTRSHGSVGRDADGVVAARTTARAERVAAAAGPQPMVRATVGIEVEPAHTLTLVPRRRRAARFAGVMCALLVFAMLGAAAFQTQLARRQVQLDQLDQQIGSAREQYDQLRRERAELRSPSRLAGIASDIGMVTATQTDFMVMTPEVLAEVQRSAGQLTDTGEVRSNGSLDQFREVKSVTDATP